jgi:hypothetical protein
MSEYKVGHYLQLATMSERTGEYLSQSILKKIRPGVWKLIHYQKLSGPALKEVKLNIKKEL